MKLLLSLLLGCMLVSGCATTQNTAMASTASTGQKSKNDPTDHWEPEPFSDSIFWDKPNP